MAKLKKCVIDVQGITKRFNQNYDRLLQARMNAYPVEAPGPDFAQWTEADFARDAEKFRKLVAAQTNGLGGLMNKVMNDDGLVK